VIPFLLEAGAQFSGFWHRINKINELKLALTNPPAVIDRMDDCLAMYHKKFDAHCISFVSTQRLVCEEASGAIKTLKRLEHTNPSVRMDRMDDYQAIYHKTSDAPRRYPLSMSKA
jgi:hypothetical protein